MAGLARVSGYSKQKSPSKKPKDFCLVEDTGVEPVTFPHEVRDALPDFANQLLYIAAPLFSFNLLFPFKGLTTWFKIFGPNYDPITCS
jgi:hypothetical protein